VDRGKKSLRKPGEPLTLGEHAFEYPSREVHRKASDIGAYGKSPEASTRTGSSRRPH
jgi:hypothetical protein